ncbi:MULTISPECIES: hypothetical protein [unclassified Thalassotalea]|uniref:hypothetical protein n=1 Tax=unclassified Thalassotalea TaxID=2614972 RepID=UPI0010811028|nr:MULTISPECIES: hypothetical protein [unclassified Thalassotalea]NMP15904.1 hypothetical protein [Thalassotalea sp. Y01]QBY04932.1 hypothetical protein E2K93_11300 [Thalassotalea sp. HSM 43]
MDIDNIKVGMICTSRKGSGRVSWVDGATQTVYMTDLMDNNSIQVGIEEIVDDPQVHTHEDYYY